MDAKEALAQVVAAFDDLVVATARANDHKRATSQSAVNADEDALRKARGALDVALAEARVVLRAG